MHCICGSVPILSLAHLCTSISYSKIIGTLAAGVEQLKPQKGKA
jgi:hypothetical protein